ncbi:Replicase polyprotein 1ab [Micromonospora echinospora]|uniref:Replicase polyprotein 1ab n=1 Tax=Micromonospora echinospora TaxID=1877 RepID=UPI0033C2CD26
MLSLAKPVAETVARHLVATGQLIDEDPAEALAHALAARRLAARISAVREAVGLAAYHAGEWQTAIAELRTYHRMTGSQSHLAVLADCERALERPERAIDLFRGADRDALDPAAAIELLIVAAGARGDLGQKDAAVAMLQVRELTGDQVQPWTARLRYAYADALLAADRREEAREWFARAAEADPEAETDAAERLLELDGVVLEGDEDEDDEASADEDATGADASETVRAEDDTTVTGKAGHDPETRAEDVTAKVERDPETRAEDVTGKVERDRDTGAEDGEPVGDPGVVESVVASDDAGHEVAAEAGTVDAASEKSDGAPEADRR